MEKKLIIFGIGELGKMVHFYFSNESRKQVLAFTVSKEFAVSKEYLGLPVILFEDIEENYSPREFDMFIAIGYKKNNKLRAEFYNKAKEKGYNLVSYISPKATVYNDLNVGDNCFIFE